MTRRIVHVTLVTLMVLVVCLAGASQPSPGKIQVLVVDETKTFLSTMRVAGLVGALRQVGIFDVSVALGDVTSSYDDPLAGQEAPEDPYDVIVILPRGLDDGSINSLWVVSNGLDLVPAPVRASVDVISQIAEQVFADLAEAVDVHEDLFPAFLWGLYTVKGWVK